LPFLKAPAEDRNLREVLLLPFFQAWFVGIVTKKALLVSAGLFK